MVALPVILTPPPSSSSPMPWAKRKSYGLSADPLPSIARRALGSAKLGGAPTDLTVKPLVPPVTVTWAWPLARLVTHVPGAKVPWRALKSAWLKPASAMLKAWLVDRSQTVWLILPCATVKAATPRIDMITKTPRDTIKAEPLSFLNISVTFYSAHMLRKLILVWMPKGEGISAGWISLKRNIFTP